MITLTVFLTIRNVTEVKKKDKSVPTLRRQRKQRHLSCENASLHLLRANYPLSEHWECETFELN